VLSVFGTRPEVIKMAPVVRELERHPERFVSRTCLTGQHRQMAASLLQLFQIEADYDLRPNQSLEHVTTAILTRMGEILQRDRPDYVLVQGDGTAARRIVHRLGAGVDRHDVCLGGPAKLVQSA